MKNKAASYLKRIITVLTSMAKSNTLALKSKTNALKTRLIIFSLLQHNNTFFNLSSINHKLHSLLGHHHQPKFDPQPDLVLHTNNAITHDLVPDPTHTHYLDYASFNNYGSCENDREEEEKYPDLTHSLFGTEDDLELEGSVIDLVKNSKQQEGQEFRLEDEIDQVADLFIKKFHRQMRLQKQQSVKRHQEMMLQSRA